MGIELNNPIILGASNLVTDLDNLKKAEELGAGAIIYRSLFEEQIQLERFQLDERLTEFNDLNAEMVQIHPNIEHAEYSRVQGEHRPDANEEESSPQAVWLSPSDS